MYELFEPITNAIIDWESGQSLGTAGASSTGGGLGAGGCVGMMAFMVVLAIALTYITLRKK